MIVGIAFKARTWSSRQVSRWECRQVSRWERKFLFWLHDRIIERLGDVHPDLDVFNAGQAAGLRFAASELEHYSWGHPEITMLRASKAMEAYAKEWDPEELEAL